MKVIPLDINSIVMIRKKGTEKKKGDSNGIWIWDSKARRGNR
jgi:hypothetical protein